MWAGGRSWTRRLGGTKVPENRRKIVQKSRNVADVHHLRLMSLLSELVRKRGTKGAARVLGIDRRTVATSVRAGVLSGRVREALERAPKSFHSS